MGLMLGGYWNGPNKATPMSIVMLSPTGMAPSGITSRKSLSSLWNSCLLWVHSRRVQRGSNHTGILRAVSSVVTICWGLGGESSWTWGTHRPSCSMIRVMYSVTALTPIHWQCQISPPQLYTGVLFSPCRRGQNKWQRGLYLKRSTPLLTMTDPHVIHKLIRNSLETQVQ